jgi:hypothetical protein
MNEEIRNAMVVIPALYSQVSGFESWPEDGESWEVLRYFPESHSERYGYAVQINSSNTFFGILHCSSLKIVCHLSCGLHVSERLTYLLTHSRSWDLLEDPPILQLHRNFPAFHGTRRFNNVFTKALHWSLSWATSIQSTPSYPTSLSVSEGLLYKIK